MRVVIASKNPVKLAAAERAFAKMFPSEEIEYSTVSVPSGVADQPMSKEETLQGAMNRAERAREEYPDADYWIGQEGGLVDEGDRLRSVPWMCIIDKTGRQNCEHAASFTILPAIADDVRAGLELSDASETYFKTKGIGRQGGSIAEMTAGAIDRTSYYEMALITTLVPFTNS